MWFRKKVNSLWWHHVSMCHNAGSQQTPTSCHIHPSEKRNHTRFFLVSKFGQSKIKLLHSSLFVVVVGPTTDNSSSSSREHRTGGCCGVWLFTFVRKRQEGCFWLLCLWMIHLFHFHDCFAYFALCKDRTNKILFVFLSLQQIPTRSL